MSDRTEIALDERPIASSEVNEAVVCEGAEQSWQEQMRQLQQAFARQQDELAQQQVELDELRAEQAAARMTQATEHARPRSRLERRTSRSGQGTSSRTSSQASSRRALLKWGGAAAAAATVALVTSEQSSHAASANDGSTITAGQVNTASSTTTLQNNVSTTNPVMVIDGTQSGGTGDALRAFSANGSAVYGSSTNGWGVYGASPSGHGVYGYSSGGGFAVYGQSTSGQDIVAGGTGRVYLKTQGFYGAPTGAGTQYNFGEMILDEGCNLYICTQPGGPGSWNQVATIPAGAAGGALVLFPAPFRIYDTRPGVGAQGGGGPMSVGQIITVTITQIVDPNNSGISVPYGASGIIGDLIAITPSGSGFLGIQPSTGSHNPYAWVNYTSGVTIHNSVVVGLNYVPLGPSAEGKVDIECSQASTSMGLTITGYIVGI